MLNPAQRGVLKGMMGALFLTIIFFGATLIWPILPAPASDTALARAGYMAASLLLVIPWLLLAIGRLARHRFFTPDDIDGSGMTAGTDKARLYQAILQNTLEQTALALPVYGTFVFLAPMAWTPLLPAAAILFATGRILFWFRYERGALGRAMGFALTFYPTAVLFLAALAAAGRSAL